MIRIVLLIIVFIISGCGNSTETGAFFSKEKGHPKQWANPLAVGSDDFHGTVIKVLPTDNSGASLFLKHCAACHGKDATGKIGPNIRGVPLSLIDFAIANVPLMSGHSILSQDERENIAQYLSTLGDNAEPETAAVDASACKACHGPDLDGGISGISCFFCHADIEGGIGHSPAWASSRDDPVHFHGRYGKDFVEACAACHGVDLQGGARVIAPGCSDCHNSTTAPMLEPFLLTL